MFPLTVAVQRIALESASALGVNPDSFGRDVPGREAWASIALKACDCAPPRAVL